MRLFTIQRHTHSNSNASSITTPCTHQAESEAGAAGKKGKEIAGKEKALQTLGEERARLTATRDEKQDERKV